METLFSRIELLSSIGSYVQPEQKSALVLRIDLGAIQIWPRVFGSTLLEHNKIPIVQDPHSFPGGKSAEGTCSRPTGSKDDGIGLRLGVPASKYDYRKLDNLRVTTGSVFRNIQQITVYSFITRKAYSASGPVQRRYQRQRDSTTSNCTTEQCQGRDDA